MTPVVRGAHVAEPDTLAIVLEYRALDIIGLRKRLPTITQKLVFRFPKTGV
jgi:hypothetical protein